MENIIGGEFSISSIMLNESNVDNTITYSSGRNALYAILRNIELNQKPKVNRKIMLPDYLCDSITNTIQDVNWKYHFYNVNTRLHANIDNIDFETFDAILLINYFGMIDVKEDINKIRKIAPNIVIIEDDVQAYYEMPNSEADYAFTSLRKWFPCPDGALIKAKHLMTVDFEDKESFWAQYKLAGNLLKSYSTFVDDRLALDLLFKGEALLEEDYQCKCSKASKIIYSNLEFDKIAEKRKENAKYLHNELEKLEVRHIYSDKGVPLFVPIFIKNRDEIRERLFNNNIFAPKHWPKGNEEISGTNVLYNNELSLICDQRYGEEEMRLQIDILKECLGC